MGAMIGHRHDYRPVRVQEHPLDAVWFRCDCGARIHPMACIDDDGKIECVCGLEEAQWCPDPA